MCFLLTEIYRHITMFDRHCELKHKNFLRRKVQPTLLKSFYSLLAKVVLPSSINAISMKCEKPLTKILVHKMPTCLKGKFSYKSKHNSIVDTSNIDSCWSIMFIREASHILWRGARDKASSQQILNNTQALNNCRVGKKETALKHKQIEASR